MKTILFSIIVLLFSFPLQAQKTKQQSRFALPENKTQQRYTDSSFEAAVNSTDISIFITVQIYLARKSESSLKVQESNTKQTCRRSMSVRCHSWRSSSPKRKQLQSSRSGRCSRARYTGSVCARLPIQRTQM